jgi:hypothetical protein
MWMGNLINKHMMNNFYHGNLLFCGSVFSQLVRLKVPQLFFWPIYSVRPRLPVTWDYYLWITSGRNKEGPCPFPAQALRRLGSHIPRKEVVIG